MLFLTNGQPTPPQSSTVMYRTHMISDPHEIRLYRNYQRARYQTTEFPTYFKGPNPSIRKLINLELVHKRRENKEERERLLVRRLLPGATLLVTSRPLATQELPMEFREQLHEHIEVVGFSDNDIDEYVKCKFCDTPDILKDFQSYISFHPFIYKAMYIPLHCALVTDLYQTYWRKGKKEFAPKTITQLYTCFIHSLLERYLDDHPVYGPQELCVQELTDLRQDVFDDLMILASALKNH